MPKPIGNLARPVAKVEPPTQNTSEQSQTLEQVLADRLVEEVDMAQLTRHLLSGLKRKFIDWLANSGSVTAIAEVETLRVIEGGENDAA